MSRTFAALLAAALTLAAAVTALAQDATYRTPPAPVGDIVNAKRLPTGAPKVSPDGSRLIVPDLPSLVPIASLAEPVERLAGIELLPGLRANRSLIKFAATGFSTAPVTGGAKVRADLPADARVVATEWSNDSRYVACAVMAPGGADLWIVEAATGAARRIEGVKLNAVIGAPIEWSNDDRAIYCAAVPTTLPALVEPSRVPTGPQLKVGAGRAAAQRTARDVLKTSDDQARFVWYLSSQLTRVPVAGGAAQRIGAPAMIGRWSIAPDERHILVQRLASTPPLGFPFYLFPTITEVWNPDGTVAAKVGDSPLNDRSAVASVATLGPRDANWSPDGKSIFFFSWQDTPGADPMKAVRDTTQAQPGTDRLMRLDEPFTGEARLVTTSTDMQFTQMAWIGESTRLAIRAGYDPRRVERRLWLDTARPEAVTVLTLRSTEGSYDNPGTPLPKRAAHRQVLWSTGKHDALYLAGPGFSKDGQRPFLDRLDLASGKTTRLYQSEATHLEPVVALLDGSAKRFLTSRESNREPRNYWLRQAGKKSGTRITDHADPAPALTAAQRVQFKFTRPDGVSLNAEAVLPPDWSAGKALPTVFWIYPNDYRSAAAASQNRRSPNRFPSQSPLNPEVLVTQGYCVVYPDIAVVGTNDQYVEQIRLSAQAAVDECVKRSYTDRERIGVGGHSYGAFSTANMLAHTDLFRAGVASDGAYNRTLTPFTFQAEDRTLWQARETYLKMSPFMYADQINEPLLLMHNLDDANVGTHPMQSDRMYEALNGMGKTVTLVNYPYEDHGPAAKESVWDYWARAIEWYDKYVKNAKTAGTKPTASEGNVP